MRARDASLNELRDALWSAQKVIAEQQSRLDAVGELIGIEDFARRISSSWAWRTGHFLTRTLRRLTLRPVKGRGAMPRLLAHISAARETLGTPALAPSVPEYVMEALSTPDTRSPIKAAELVPPRDSTGLLRAENSDATGSVDVIVCVHDALEDVHRCFWSLFDGTSRPFRLIVVDDGSEEGTADYLDRFAKRNPAVDLHRRHDPPHGYTIAANVGLRASSADYVVLLNSDTIVSRGWLERLIEVGEADDRIGLIGPLSNAASHQSVPVVKEDGGWAVNELPHWLTVDGMALLVAGLPGDAMVRVPFLNGFCLCIRRRTIDAIGLFDEERFASGYGEENDYAIRAQDAGLELAVATRSYVHHRKSRSYGMNGRAVLSRQSTRTLLDRHGEDRVSELVAEIQDNASLRLLRHRMSEALSSASQTAERIPRLRISFVLPGLRRGGSGGSHSVYQEVSAMRSLGLPARVLVAQPSLEGVLGTYPGDKDLFTPYEDEAESVQPDRRR